jgi:NADPH:quinone reductase-like Zn-dependent oxidoreductase
MKAGIVVAPGKPPIYGDFPEPVAAAGEVRLSVRAAALSNLVKSRASGAHYSSSGELPFVVGIDGAGVLADGRRVYFVFPRPPFGSMSEVTVVPSAQCLPLPDDLSDVTAAATANPGMSSWAALTERARLVPGETVLVNGATGTAGRLAVQIAKHLGARKVVATGRNADALSDLSALGADVTIPLGDGGDALEEALRAQYSDGGIDIVVDYLWGPSAERILIAGAKSGKKGVPIRFVHVGSSSGSEMTLPGAVLRSSPITLMGSGIGSVPMDRLLGCIGAVLQATGPAHFEIRTRTVPLSDLERTWETAGGTPRTVFQIP